MKAIRTLLPVLLLSLIPSVSWAYGEGEYIPMTARALHLLTNEARSDVARALSGCGDNCLKTESYYSFMKPLYWSDPLGNASQFYANMLAPLKCIQHETPCRLKYDAVRNYPQNCNGNASCACEGGVAQCNSNGTDTFDRIEAFLNGKGYQALGENLFFTSDTTMTPRNMFKILLHENGNITSGHREAILNDEYNAIGTGYAGGIGVQEFAKFAQPEKAQISSGAVYPEDDDLIYAMHFYDAQRKVKTAALVIGTDSCYKLDLTTGKEKNGVYSAKASNLETIDPAVCTPFYFEVEMDDGSKARYPTSGSLLSGACQGRSWDKASASTCLGVSEITYVAPKTGKKQEKIQKVKTNPTSESTPKRTDGMDNFFGI